jgi:hypothetical protein
MYNVFQLEFIAPTKINASVYVTYNGIKVRYGKHIYIKAKHTITYGLIDSTKDKRNKEMHPYDIEKRTDDLRNTVDFIEKPPKTMQIKINNKSHNISTNEDIYAIGVIEHYFERTDPIKIKTSSNKYRNYIHEYSFSFARDFINNKTKKYDLTDMIIKVKKHKVKSFKTDRLLSLKTINDLINIIRATYRFNKYEPNPAKEIQLEVPQNERLRYLTPEEVQKLLETIDQKPKMKKRNWQNFLL